MVRRITLTDELSRNTNVMITAIEKKVDQEQTNKRDNQLQVSDQSCNPELLFKEVESTLKKLGGDKRSKGNLNSIKEDKIVVIDKADRLELVRKYHVAILKATEV